MSGNIEIIVIKGSTLYILFSITVVLHNDTKQTITLNVDNMHINTKYINPMAAVRSYLLKALFFCRYSSLNLKYPSFRV